MEDILIIGGGLAGLTNAILLAKAGLDVTLIEKKEYPFHRLCGEYVSNEALPFLNSLGIDPFEHGASIIDELILSTPAGNLLKTSLDLGGFGMSRYVLDELLYKKALEAGVKFHLKTRVMELNFTNDTDSFEIILSNGKTLISKVAIGSFGKRSSLDRQLQRPFFKKRSPYVAVKYHIKTDFPSNAIALHIFKDGYCGVNPVEDGKVCLCYLTTRENLKNSGSIPELEQHILKQNQYLKDILDHAEILYDKPEVINEVSFASKETVVNHVLMCGDAAGMIAPLCGNGMAMAIHGAKICSEEVVKYFNTHHSRSVLENTYSKRWNKVFSARLARGRFFQNLFYKPFIMENGVNFCNAIPLFGRWLVKQTHGETF